MLSEWTSVFPNVYSTASWLWGRGLLADSASASRTSSKPLWKTSTQSHGRVLLLRDVLGAASSGRAPSPLKRTGSAKQRRRGSSASLEPPALQHQVQSHDCSTCSRTFRARIGLISHSRTHRPQSLDQWVMSWLMNNIVPLRGRYSINNTFLRNKKLLTCWSCCQNGWRASSQTSILQRADCGDVVCWRTPQALQGHPQSLLERL